MYESYYGFERAPFKLVADPSMLFASRSVREALGRLEFAMKTGKGIVVMTGEVGTGKTTLVNRFLDKAGDGLRTAYIFNPTLDGMQLLRTLAEELGVERVPESKAELMHAIHEVLLRNRESGQRTVVFVDEAQVLDPGALEELRLVSNLETWREKLLHIVLVGQPEVLKTLESFELRPLRQRVELFIAIEPMSASETRQYVEHRVRTAKPMREIAFDDAALDAVHDVSGGNPRDVNKVCDAALLVAYVDERAVVSAQHVSEAIATLDPQNISLRPPTQRRRMRWRRAWGAAAMLAVLAALGFTFDTARAPKLQTRQPDAVSRAAAPVAAERAERSTAPAPLIHLGSFRERARAEDFARGIRPGNGRRVYLQRAEVRGTTWHRVLLGDFDSFAEAEAYAQRVHGEGTYAYAQPVRVAARGLETWRAP